jgi:hypothetical protein
MTEPADPPHDAETARQARLRDALRANLKRRKAQARGRAAPATDPARQMHGRGDATQDEDE